MSNDQHGNHWPDHGHESKWPSDAYGDRPRRSGWGRGPGLLWSLLIACLVVALLVGSEYLSSLEKRYALAQELAKEERAKKEYAEKEKREPAVDIDKAMREFRWPDPPTRKHTGKRNSTEGDKP